MLTIGHFTTSIAKAVSDVSFIQESSFEGYEERRHLAR